MERARLISKVKSARGHVQLLLEFAAAAANTNPRSCSATPTSRRASIEDQVGNEAQRRPNMHTALHYEAAMQEYGISSNLNVLIGEDKHRWFKKVIYQSNYIDVEASSTP
ncbi:hypothetical protein BDR22DRAFT_872331 [Usnea florida]